MKRTTHIPAKLIVACGMNCGVCMAYLREKNTCPGCRSRSRAKPNYCLRCPIRFCHKKPGVSAFCFECSTYPCARLKHLDKRYRTRYGMSMLENLENIKKLDLAAFMKRENTRWVCPTCGSPISVHNKKCYTCEYAGKKL